jgi:D-threonine aldolase
MCDAMTDNTAWWTISNVAEIPSPALLVYPDRAIENIRRMIAIAGGVDRLRPHIKTHKLAPLIEAHVHHGISKFKCATIAEAEMVAASGGADVLLAYQPVGPNIARLVALAATFPRTRFSAVVDTKETAREISAEADRGRVTIGVFVDLDVGMHRTGIAPGPEALELYRTFGSLPGVRAEGLHAYDGHLRDRDVSVRAASVDDAFAPVVAMRQALVADGHPVPQLVAGGTPTFPVHAKRAGADLSPGTCIFWDAGYGTLLPDLDFLSAALVLTRVVSKPGGARVCVDLGHKAIAAENPHPRVVLIQPDSVKASPTSTLLGAPVLECTFVGHSEEHLVFESPHAGSLQIGDALYGIPWHVCPTVSLHSEAVIVRNHSAEERWRVTARERRITI